MAALIADLWSFGNSNVVNTISNALAIPTLAGVAAAVWHAWHSRCAETLCMRPGQVPIPGDTKLLCCRHASREGIDHGDA